MKKTTAALALLILATQGCSMGDLAPGVAQITITKNNTPCFTLPQQLASRAKDPKITNVVLYENRQPIWEFNVDINSAPSVSQSTCIPLNTLKMGASGAPVSNPEPIKLKNNTPYLVTVVARDSSTRGDAARLIGDAYFCIYRSSNGAMQLLQAPSLNALRYP